MFTPRFCYCENKIRKAASEKDILFQGSMKSHLETEAILCVAHKPASQEWPHSAGCSADIQGLVFTCFLKQMSLVSLEVDDLQIFV